MTAELAAGWTARPTELGAKSPDVPSNGGLRGYLLTCEDELNLSFDSSFPLYDKGTSWDFLILFTFFPFIPKSGKRISKPNIFCRDKGLAHQGLRRPAPYSIAIGYEMAGSCRGTVIGIDDPRAPARWVFCRLLKARHPYALRIHSALILRTSFHDGIFCLSIRMTYRIYSVHMTVHRDQLLPIHLRLATSGFTYGCVRHG